MKIIMHYSKSSLLLLFNWLVQGSLAIACFTFLHIVYLYFLPVSSVFQYYKVEPVKPVFEHFETIQMRTTADWYRDAEVQWIDSLRCPPIHFVSQDITYSHKIKGDKARGEWLYGKPTPMIDSECYIESNIIATIEYGIQKIATVRSSPFIIR